MMFFLTFCLRWPLLRTDRSHLLPPCRVTDVRLHWKEKTQMTMVMVRQMFSVFGLFVGLRCGLTEVTSPARHLPDSAPLQANNALPVQAAELPPPSSLLQCSCSPSFSFNCFKIMVAVCFACLTDSSGSGWLPPRTLSRFFLILTALLTHLVTTNPSAWLLCSSLCGVLCLIHQIVRVNCYNLCGTWWLLFRHYTWPHPPHVPHSCIRSERFKPFCCHFLIPKERNWSFHW